MNCLTVSTFGRNIPPEFKAIAETIAGWDCLAYSTSESAIRELKRYFLLRCILRRPITMQSPIVDEVWHRFILDTQNYRRFCDAILGEYLDHQRAHFELDAEFPTRYEALFGEALPMIWTPWADDNGNCA